uniref:RNA-directed DNA polymerase n=2 Tax=Lygus hesperus TaxID=30085 RepID=A0A0A9XSU2_LYGHE
MPDTDEPTLLHCEKCERPLPDDQQTNPIFCMNCVSTYHAECVGIQYSNWTKLPTARKQSYLCKYCKESEKTPAPDMPALTQAVIKGVTTANRPDPGKTPKYLDPCIQNFTSFNINSPPQIMHFLLKLREIHLVSPQSIAPMIRQLSLQPNFTYFKQLLRRWQGDLNYDTLSTAIKKELFNTNIQLQLTMKYIQRLQKPNEEFREFAERVIGANDLLQAYTDAQLIDIIMSHVLPKDRQYFVHTTKPTNKDELYSLIQQVEVMHREFHTASNFSRNRYQQYNVQPKKVYNPSAMQGYKQYNVQGKDESKYRHDSRYPVSAGGKQVQNSETFQQVKHEYNNDKQPFLHSMPFPTRNTCSPYNKNGNYNNNHGNKPYNAYNSQPSASGKPNYNNQRTPTQQRGGIRAMNTYKNFQKPKNAGEPMPDFSAPSSNNRRQGNVALASQVQPQATSRPCEPTATSSSQYIPDNITKLQPQWMQHNNQYTNNKTMMTRERMFPLITRQSELELTIENKPCIALLDTGSTSTAINKDYFSTHFQHVNTHQIPRKSIIAAGGSELATSKAATLKVQIANNTWQHNFLIIPDLSIDMVLGMDFMTRVKLIYNIAEGTISFQHSPDIIVPLSTNEDTNITNYAFPTAQVESIKVFRQIPDNNNLMLPNILNLYPDVLNEIPGKTDVVNCKVVLQENAQPPKARCAYHINPNLLPVMKEEIAKLLRLGIITPFRGTPTAACFLVPKQKKHPEDPNTYRLVCDFRALNKVLQYHSHPIPTIPSLLAHLNKARVFTLFDMNSAYNQIPISEDSQHLVSFTTPFANYKYNYVPFGLATGGNILSELMHSILGDLHATCVIWFLDDVLVYSPDIKTHVSDVQKVLDRFRQAHITLSASKLQFACTTVKFLGHVITQGTVTIDQGRSDILSKLERPRNTKGIAQFLGAVGFFQPFIPKYAELCVPLNKMRKKNIPFNWTPDCEQSYTTLINILSNPPVLALPDFTVPFSIWTDASNNAISYVLTQIDPHTGKHRPVAFAGRKLSESELKYTIYEKEFLAALQGICKFRFYVEHSKFTLYTDNKSIATITKMDNPNARIQRWVTRLISYNFSIKHIPSRQNAFADYLSRAEWKPTSSPLATATLPVKAPTDGQPRGHDNGMTLPSSQPKDQYQSDTAQIFKNQSESYQKTLRSILQTDTKCLH